MTDGRSRRGAVLLVVAGISAILAGLALAFLVRMRSDAEESAAFSREVQARVMVAAALAYVQETSRLGWDDPATPIHEEAYGWRDVRDGSPGPKDYRHEPLAAFDPVSGLGASFPAVGGKAARCPAYLQVRPPCAVETTASYNPLPRHPGPDWRKSVSYANAEPRAVAGGFAEFVAGNPTPVARTAGRAWFRVYRMTQADCDRHRDALGNVAAIRWSPAVFTLTCGSGPTLGYKDWAEVVADGAEAAFGNDPELFDGLRKQESVFWYDCEWSAAEGYVGHKYFHADLPVPGAFPDGYSVVAPAGYAQSPTNRPWKDDSSHRPNSRNFGGSFLWIERLARMPENW